MVSPGVVTVVVVPTALVDVAADKTVMMARDKGGGYNVSSDYDITMMRRTSEMWAAHLMVSLTITYAPAHGLQGYAGVWAGVVGLVTNV